MKIYDISKGYFTAPVYPGDPVPRLERLQQMQLGDKFNLTAYYGGAHAATHMDAPRHFVDDGATIDQVPLEACFGPCTVLSVSGILTGEDADEILQFTQPRLLLRGEGSAYLSQSGAFALADGGIALVGTDASSIAPYEDADPLHEDIDSPCPGLTHRYPDRVLLLITDQCSMYCRHCTRRRFAGQGLEAAPVRAVLLEE